MASNPSDAIQSTTEQRPHFGIVGLGRMGSSLARQAIGKGHAVVGYNRTRSVTESMVGEGLAPAWTLQDLPELLAQPRLVFVYVSHGEATEAVCQELRSRLDPGDTVVDGGNSHWGDSERRYRFFAEAGVHFLDVGTSGGISGAGHGACFMAGGDRDVFERAAPVLRSLAIDDHAVLYVGPPGSGHFVKLVHNAIEFGMVQAIAEGAELLVRSERDLELPALFENWNHGSVIRGWLVELMASAFREGPGLSQLSPYVEDTGEVKWLLNWAANADIATPVISVAQTALMQYRDSESVAAKAVAKLRNQYGEHPLHSKSGRGWPPSGG